MRWGRVCAAAVVALASVCFAPAAAPQEAIHTDSAAAVPSVGHVSLRQTLTFMTFDDPVEFEERDVQEWRAVTTLEYGLRNDLALSLYVPIVYREEDLAFLAEQDLGIDDFTIAAKWRVYRNDFGPIDTSRLSLVAALELPSGMDDFSSDSVDPIVGAVYSYIQGRHGFNADVRWKFTTGGEELPMLPGEGTADALFYNASYLYRLRPAQFGAANSAGAVYGVVELNGAFETNRDHQLLLSPGLLYEARTYAVEASVQIPILQNLDDRPEMDFSITLGVRFLF
jgi:hypothetical protein